MKKKIQIETNWVKIVKIDRIEFNSINFTMRIFCNENTQDEKVVKKSHTHTHTYKTRVTESAEISISEFHIWKRIFFSTMMFNEKTEKYSQINSIRDQMLIVVVVVVAVNGEWWQQQSNEFFCFLYSNIWCLEVSESERDCEYHFWCSPYNKTKKKWNSPIHQKYSQWQHNKIRQHNMHTRWCLFVCVCIYVCLMNNEQNNKIHHPHHNQDCRFFCMSWMLMGWRDSEKKMKEKWWWW